MSDDESIYDAVLCHCDVDPEGHVPGADGCAVVLRAGRYGPDPLPGRGRPRCGLDGPPADHKGATGTCPVCGREGVKVRRVEYVGTTSATKRTATGRPIGGCVLMVRPEVAEHGGCVGAGRPPAETRWESPRVADLDVWRESWGPDSVVAR